MTVHAASTHSDLEPMTTPSLTPDRAIADRALRLRVATITATATAHEARQLIRETGQSVLVVTNGAEAVGIITEAELWAGGGGPRGNATLNDILVWELVKMRSDADVEQTLRRYRNSAWASLFRRRPGRRSTEEHPCTF
jgi:hypothetical protein